METSNVFIASSSELKKERDELVDLLLDLNDELEEQGIKFKSELWEFMDSSMRAGRKEDEYLEKLRQCEICLVLFWRTLGEYTKEELDVAVEEMMAGRLPRRVYVLFKMPDDGISKELYNFKQEFMAKYPNIPSFIFEGIEALRKILEDVLTKNS